MLHLDSLRDVPDFAQARAMATEIIHENGDFAPINNKWIYHFVKRNPQVKSLFARSIDINRIEGYTPEALKAFYTLIGDKIKEFHITP